MTELIRFNVDGRETAVAAEVDETLIDLLRGQLGLMSAREACGIGICGSCTVALDGKQVSSCLIVAGQIEGRTIETLEGPTWSSGADDETAHRMLHPIQQAFIDANAFQCSYCTPGFLMATRELLEVEPDPSPRFVREFLAGNLCRCGSYPKIEAAVLDAAARLRGTGSAGGDGPQPDENAKAESR